MKTEAELVDYDREHICETTNTWVAGSQAPNRKLVMRNGIGFFPHRLNKDGSYDSICLKCLDTVARAETEAELVDHEITHICDATRLAERRFVQPPALYIRNAVE